ncbi:VOC family protein [Serratia rubidaea]|uniref:Predicted lactoylglutathione lyase n=1 Tax=Serratia rubidaea TaxID=61652 RepID=A0A448SQT0_SERRU|nr:VOC family protein [Serratia rubidaea]MBD8452953.1 VOC family protein [Serratia rubidaea]MBH1929184.1 VOC family protein [Serratia rubidaea]MDC6119012.1 VOC family protein [Serratia rubidaea]MEB7585101.1 VOC family protein [Serratia rubidaea]UJD80479.1 drug:proton antiporter [Serratia rubidaea]
MTMPSMTMLYVTQPERSAAFYQRLLGQPPVELSATFALFVLSNGFKFGLWAADGVEPAPQATGGGAEICISCEQPQQVDALYRQWQALGGVHCHTPAQMDFGYTFVAEDPDGHRLRVYHLNA